MVSYLSFFAKNKDFKMEYVIATIIAVIVVGLGWYFYG